MPVTIGQINFEFQHLLQKLKVRYMKKYEEIKDEKRIEPNPIFYIIDEGIEDWEKDKKVLNKKKNKFLSLKII